MATRVVAREAAVRPRPFTVEKRSVGSSRFSARPSFIRVRGALYSGQRSSRYSGVCFTTRLQLQLSFSTCLKQ